MVWVPTEVKGKLAEHDPIPKEMPMFLPKQILSYLLMEIQLEIDMDEIQRFWRHAKRFSLPWANASHDGIHVPLALYGDSAKFSAIGEKVTGIFMSMPLWNPRSARFSRFLLCAVETYTSLGGLTLNPVFKEIVDSMWDLYTNGLQIKGKTYKFVVVELRGDWEWHCHVFQLTCTWRSDQFCWRCQADKKNHPNFLDFGDDPSWTTTERTQAEFLAQCVPLHGSGGPCGKPRTKQMWHLFLHAQCIYIHPHIYDHDDEDEMMMTMMMIMMMMIMMIFRIKQKM